jgi:ABC-2 type transport system ATP-binding protein
MRLELDAAALGSGPAAAVPPLTLAVTPGRVAVLAVETDDRPMLVSLLLGGRLAPETGRLLVDGEPAPRDVRHRVALVDTPTVAEAPAGVKVATVVAEELALAGRRSGGRAVRGQLARLGIEGLAAAPLRSVATGDRIRLLVDLARQRPGVDALVLTSPERHGGDPAAWYPALTALPDLGIVVVTDATTRDTLIELGARDATEPLPTPRPVESDPA